MIWIPVFLSLMSAPVVDITLQSQYVIPFAKPWNPPAPRESNDNSSGRFSVTAGRIDDLRWQDMLLTADPATRPVPVTLPFLDDYPFENFEVKVKLFRTSF